MARKTNPEPCDAPADAEREDVDLSALPPALRETVERKIKEGDPDATEGVSAVRFQRVVRKAARSERPDRSS